MLQKYIRKFVIITLISTSLTLLSVGASYANTNGQVTVTANILNLRESPNTTSKIVGKLKNGEQLKVLQSSGEWYKVSSDRLTGWVSAKYVKNSNASNESKSTTIINTDSNLKSNVKFGKITGNNVNVRKGPGLSYTVIKQLNKGESLEILEKTEKWYNVKLSDNIVGWVSSSYILECKEEIEVENQLQNQSVNGSANNSDINTNNVSDKDTDKVSEKESDTFLSSSSSEQGSQESSSVNSKNNYQTSELGTVVISDLIDFAQSLVGVKYTYGGTSPETGFDCSGFTQYVFGTFDINLERVAADQAKQGIEVALEDLQPGDLVFSDTDGGNNNINHVGIYIGDGKFISATSGSNSAKVTVSSLESSYWKETYMTARRIVKNIL